MFGGLFQTSIDSVINDSIKDMHLSEHTANFLHDKLEPVKKVSVVPFYLLMSLFVVYFALFKPRSPRSRVLVLAAKVLIVFVYVPILLWFGAYVDAVLIAVTILARLLYTGYYAYVYKNWAFVTFNTHVLCFVVGKPWFYEKSHYGLEFLAISGGDHYVAYGGHTVAFASDNELYVAIRGSVEKDLKLMRKIEMYNGNALFVFAEEPVVGIVNTSCDIQLYEDVPTIN
ncbi:NS3 protein [Triaenops bat coronavirus]|nr:NS3 protein [Triaenops bat coronavirus]